MTSDTPHQPVVIRLPKGYTEDRGLCREAWKLVQSGPKTFTLQALEAPSASLPARMKLRVNAGEFDHAPADARSDAVYELKRFAQRYPDQTDIAVDLAVKLLLRARHYEHIEALEEERLLALYRHLQDDPGYARAMAGWGRSSVERKIEVLTHVVRNQAAIFGFEPAYSIQTFSLSRQAHEQAEPEGIYPAGFFAQQSGAFGTQPGLENIIGINVHEDADGLRDSAWAVSIAVHENVHKQQQDLHEAEGAYRRFFEGMGGTTFFEPLSREQKFRFYRAEMMERHSHAVHEKFAALMRGEKMPKERQLVEWAVRKKAVQKKQAGNRPAVRALNP